MFDSFDDNYILNEGILDDISAEDYNGDSA